MKTLFAISLMALCSVPLFTQRTIEGNVSDASDQSPLIGANVVLRGTNTGTVTDTEGQFRLTLPAQDHSGILLISYAGYETREVILDEREQYQVILQAGVLDMAEVVVIGYGTQQKRKLTGNVATVRAEELAELPVQSFDQLIQGQAAGVDVHLPNGVLNNPPVFRIRGINSISLSSYPLVVIDGVPSYTGDLSSTYFNTTAHNALSGLNPEDIESIDVLKDASAAAIYGSRAAGGVVLITTKSGKSGRTQVSLNSWMGLTEPARLPQLLDARQYVEIKNEAAHNAGLPDQFFLDSLNGKLINTNWFDHIYRTGVSHNHNLNISGGNAATSYYLSLGYSDQEGFIRFNSFERTSGRFNIQHQIGQRIRIGANIGYSDITNRAPDTGSLPGGAFFFTGIARLALLSPPNVSPYLADGSYNISNGGGYGPNKNLQPLGFGYGNPLPVLENDQYTNESGQLQAAVHAEAELLPGLSVRTQYGLNNIETKDEFYSSPLYSYGYYLNGYSANQGLSFQRWNWQNLLNFERNFGDHHQLGLLLGHEQQYSYFNIYGAELLDVADPYFSRFSGNFNQAYQYGETSENYLRSWFGRLSYAYDDKYLLQANVRQDAYSAFAPGQQEGTFWGVSAGWILSGESFWQNSLGQLFNFFKLRGSYGEVGNNAVSDYASQGLYNPQFYADNAAFIFTQAGNPNLSWETSKKTDIGIQFGLLQDRLQGEYAWFHTLVDGLLLQTPQPASLGVPGNAIAANVGSMRNSGHEFSLSGTLVRGRQFSWRSTLNLTLVKNEVLQLADGDADIFGFTSNFEPTNIVRVGESVGSLYALPTAGVNPANGRRIFLLADGSEVQYQHVVGEGASRWTYVTDGSPASAPNLVADGRVYGPALPTWYGGWNHNLQYGNFDLLLQFSFAGGNYIYNGTKAGLRDQRSWNNHTDVLDRWSESNSDGTIPQVVYGDNLSNGSAIPISENIEKGDFLRLRNITLGYRLPTTWLGSSGIRNLRLYAGVFNALLFTGYSGSDPEISTNGNNNLTPSVDRNTVPMARTFTFGLNLDL